MSLAAEEMCDQYECVGCLSHGTEYCPLLNIKGSNSMLSYKLPGFPCISPEVHTETVC